MVSAFARSARLVALACCAALLGACSTLDKDLPVPDEPADKLYNEGLYLLNQKKDTKSAAKKFEEVDRQHPYSEWARKSLIMTAYRLLRGGRLRRLHQRCPALRLAASRKPGRGLRAVPDRRRPISTRSRKSRATRTAPRRRFRPSTRSCANIRAPNMRRRQDARSRSRAISWPARKWISADSY